MQNMRKKSTSFQQMADEDARHKDDPRRLLDELRASMAASQAMRARLEERQTN